MQIEIDKMLEAMANMDEAGASLPDGSWGGRVGFAGWAVVDSPPSSVHSDVKEIRFVPSRQVPFRASSFSRSRWYWDSALLIQSKPPQVH